MDAELQAIPGMDQTAFFAVWERLLRAFTRGSLLNDSGPAISCLFRAAVRFRGDDVRGGMNYDAGTMSIHAIDENADPVAQAKIDLAAALRLAVYHELEEGERLAGLLGDKQVMFLRNHGILVAVDSIAKACRMLYLLERACRAQIRAMSSGKKLLPMSPPVIAQMQTPDQHDRHKGQRDDLYFNAMKRVLDREMPGYAD